jgi:uncharacterized membrane protein YedE/YeeE
MSQIDLSVSRKHVSRMLVFGKIIFASGACMLGVTALAAWNVAHGLTTEAVHWLTSAGGFALATGAFLIGFGSLEQRLCETQAELRSMKTATPTAAPAPAEEPHPFRSRPAAIGQRRLKLI